jgi:hypothetical protein
MFRLARFLISIALLLGFAWFATSVKLGKRTLLEHVRAIFSTQEAKDLADGTKEEARKLADKVKTELARDGGAPLDPLDEKERKQLDKLIKQKTHAK